MEFDGIGLQNGSDKGGHQVGTVFSHTHHVAGSEPAVTAGNHQRGVALTAGYDLLFGGVPVKVLLAFGVTAANHELCAIQKFPLHVLVHGLCAQAGALGHHIVLNGHGRSLHVHGFPEVGRNGVDAFFYRLDVRRIHRHVQEILPDGLQVFPGRFFLLYGFADGFAEHAFDGALGPDDGNGIRCAQACNLSNGTLLKDECFYYHGANFI